MHDVQGVGQGFAPAEVSARVSDRVRAASLAVDVLIVGSVALVLGLIQLGTPSLWVDEALTAYEIRWPYSRSLEGYYWLYYSIEKPWAAIAGYSEWALRFPSVVAAMLAGALMIVLARRLFDRRIALLSGLFLVTNPFVVNWSQQARGYTMLLAVSLLATIFLLRALERGSRSAFALYGLAFAAVVVWHPVAGLVLALPHLVLILQSRDRFLPHGLLAVASCWRSGCRGSRRSRCVLRAKTRSSRGSRSRLATPSPTPCLDISGAGWLRVVLAAVGLWVLFRAGKRNLATWLLRLGLLAVRRRLVVSVVQHVFLDRLPDRRGAGVRAARSGRGDRVWHDASARRCSSSLRRRCGCRALSSVTRTRAARTGAARTGRRRPSSSRSTARRPMQPSSCRGGRTGRPSSTARRSPRSRPPDSSGTSTWSEKGHLLPPELRAPSASAITGWSITHSGGASARSPGSGRPLADTWRRITESLRPNTRINVTGASVG